MKLFQLHLSFLHIDNLLVICFLAFFEHRLGIFKLWLILGVQFLLDLIGILQIVLCILLVLQIGIDERIQGLCIFVEIHFGCFLSQIVVNIPDRQSDGLLLLKLIALCSLNLSEYLL